MSLTIRFDTSKSISRNKDMKRQDHGKVYTTTDIVRVNPGCKIHSAINAKNRHPKFQVFVIKASNQLFSALELNGKWT